MDADNKHRGLFETGWERLKVALMAAKFFLTFTPNLKPVRMMPEGHGIWPSQSTDTPEHFASTRMESRKTGPNKVSREPVQLIKAK